MMLVEPHIDAKTLETITTPTLALAADHAENHNHALLRNPAASGRRCGPHTPRTRVILGTFQ